MFRSVLVQGKVYEALICGCILVTSLQSDQEIDEYLNIELIYNLLRLYRNLDLFDLVDEVFSVSKNLELSDYDRHKIDLAYYYSYLKRPDVNQHRIYEIVDYFKKYYSGIEGFGIRSVWPWLHFFYNLHRLCTVLDIYPIIKIQECITTLESTIEPSKVRKSRARIFGEGDKTKDLFVESLLRSFETRYLSSFISEIQRLEVFALALLSEALISKNLDEILLASFVLNDQKLGFQFYAIPDRSETSFRDRYQLIDFRLNNIAKYILEGILIGPKKTLIWLFEISKSVHFLKIDPDKNFQIQHIASWDLTAMRSWIKNLQLFYFNSKEDEFNNPTKAYHYEYHEQLDDFNRLFNYFKGFEIDLSDDVDEILIITNLTLSSFPLNLLTNKTNFWGRSIPVSNVLSFDFALNYCTPEKISKNYSISAWVPYDDGEPIISWGYDLLLPILSASNAIIHTGTYPSAKIETDINVFLAHGVKDQAGFKAIYSNEKEHKYVDRPEALFGKGKIALLFICNSGFSSEDYFTNSVVSLAQEIILLGYQTVVAPLWPFDVTMAPLWLKTFLNSIDNEFSVSEAVWLANDGLSRYDAQTSSIYLSPSGCLAMHLFGNPYLATDSQ
jgi:hypothetical protein